MTEHYEAAHESKHFPWPELTGFTETSKMTAIREAIINAYETEEFQTNELLSDYRRRGERSVEEHVDRDYYRAQIGLELAVGQLKKELGDTDGYIESLYDSLDYASHVEEHDLIEVINNKIKKLQS